MTPPDKHACNKKLITDRRADRGFIVIAVLWILAALTMLVLIYSLYISRTAVAVASSTDRVQEQAALRAAIELVSYQLLNGTAAERATSGSFTGRIGTVRISAKYVSESARIDLNAAPKDLLGGFISGLGATPENAQNYASRIVAWRTVVPANAADDDSENTLYRTAGVSYLPRHAPFPHVDELWLVYGIPKFVVASMMPYVTVYSGRPSINIRDAAPQVVAGLPRMTPEKLQALLAARTTDGSDLQSLAAGNESGASLEASKAMRISIRLDFPDHVMNSEVVILLRGDAAEPYRLLSRRDNADG